MTINDKLPSNSSETLSSPARHGVARFGEFSQTKRSAFLTSLRSSLLYISVICNLYPLQVLFVLMLPGVVPRSAPPQHPQIRPISTRLTAPPPPPPGPPSPRPPSPRPPPPGTASSMAEDPNSARMIFSLPRVDPTTMSLSPSYSYGFSMPDKNLAQEVDQQGSYTGGYSWSMPGGGSTSFAYGAGQYVDALMSDSVGLNSMINSGSRTGQYSDPRISDNSLASYGPGQYDGTGMSDSNVANVGPSSVMSYGPGQYVDSLSTEDVSYRPSGPRQATSGQRYNKVSQLSGTGQQGPWSSSFSGVNTNINTNTRDFSPSGGAGPRMDSSYLMRILGRDSQWVESSDKVS